MDAPPVPGLTRLVLSQPLTVRLLDTRDHRVITEEPVLPSDCAEVTSEAWRDGCLRAGYPDVPLSELPMRLVPILAEDSAVRCTGFTLEITLPTGNTTECHFTFNSLRSVADRAMERLAAHGTANPGETYLFEIQVGRRTSASASPAAFEVAAALTMSLRSRPLSYVRLPLRPLLNRATPVALLDPEVPPVFYTEDAFSKAEACARHGATAKLESGGALLGSLAACPETGEFFSIIHDVIEVQEADEQKFSLAYTSRSWLRLQQIQQARQAAHPKRAERLLGQAHGHPFRPNDGKTCAECAKRTTCSLTSAWASSEDQSWHRAVFARQAWATCHIFGLSARGEPAHQLFGLKDGHLQPRGFFLLPDFTFD